MMRFASMTALLAVEKLRTGLRPGKFPLKYIAISIKIA
jgi:hypothetical protein